MVVVVEVVVVVDIISFFCLQNTIRARFPLRTERLEPYFLPFFFLEAADGVAGAEVVSLVSTKTASSSLLVVEAAWD
jgi:hypothetical protein